MKNKIAPNPAKLAASGTELFNALLVVCYALAAARDDEFPEGKTLEELKYDIVDRALELVCPNFDGGTTTKKELRNNIKKWMKAIDDAERKADEASAAKLTDHERSIKA